MIERWLWIRSGRPTALAAAREALWVKNMAKLWRIHGLILCAPTRVDCLHRGLGELPESHLRLVNAAKLHGIKVCHMRELWSRLGLQHELWRTAAYYAWNLGLVRGEATGLGVSMCGLDAEPNDDIGGSMLEAWKAGEMSVADALALRSAIDQLPQHADCDLVYPSNSNRGHRAYQNQMRRLGAMGVPSTTVLTQATHPNLNGCWHSQIRPLGGNITDPQAILWPEALAMTLPAGIKMHSMWCEQGRIAEMMDEMEEDET